MGDHDGRIHLYLNEGSQTNPVLTNSGFVQLGSSTFTADGPHAWPCVVDWNNDGKKDVLCGSTAGTVQLLVNTGTDAAPLFGSSVLVQDGAAAIHSANWSVPLALDWDADGKKDLLVGSGEGPVRFYRNIGEDATPAFDGFVNLIADGREISVSGGACPTVADWNNDGGSDLLLGGYGGRVKFFPVVVDATVVLESLALDDSVQGNADGVAGPGESVTLAAVLRNTGLMSTTGVVAQLSCTNSYVAVTQSDAWYGDLPGMGTTAQSDDRFRIAIASNCPTPQTLEFLLTVTDAHGNVWQLTFSATAHTWRVVSGCVTLDGQSASNVLIRYTGPLNGTVPTDALGQYSLDVLDGMYSLLASRTNWLDPVPLQLSVTSSIENADFTFLTARVDGRITDAKTGDPLPDATVQYSGALSGSVTSGVDGEYWFARVCGRETTLELKTSMAGYLDSPRRKLTVPPSASDVDFAMGYSDIATMSALLTVTGAVDQVLSLTLEIENLGADRLIWNCWDENISVEGGSPPVGAVLRQLDISTTSWCPVGLAFDGNLLFINPSESKHWSKLDPITGIEMGTLSPELGPMYGYKYDTYGIDWDGTHLWVAEPVRGQIQSIWPWGGDPLTTISMPTNCTPYGVAVGDDCMWIIDRGETVLKVDIQTGEVIASWPIPAEVMGSICGLEYAEGVLWITGWGGDGNIHVLNPEDGRVIRRFPGPSTSTIDLAENGSGSMWMIGWGTGKAHLFNSDEVAWLTASPMYGAVDGDGTGKITLTIDTSKAMIGTNVATLHIVSNDLDDPDLPISVMLKVIPDNGTDTDGDGMTDADEIRAGTDLNDPESRLLMSIMDPVVSGEMIIGWHSAYGRRYTLLASTNLFGEFDACLGTNILAAPPLNTHTNVVNGARQKFYRVRLE